MPKYYDGTINHIYNRGAHKERIFVHDEDYLRLLGLMEKYVDRYSVTMLAYCLMPNHYHLVVRQERGGSVSGFLKTTFNAFVQAINLLRKHSGTWFQGSAKGIPVDSIVYVLRLVRYIHLNPVSAGLVKKPGDWPFSDYRDWIGLRTGKLFDPVFRSEFFRTEEEYKKFVEEHKEIDDRGIFARIWMD